MRQIAAVFVAVMLALATFPQASAQSAVSEETIRAIEDQVVMPRRAQQLDLYDRYYAPDHVDGHEMIVGVFVLRSSFGGRARDSATPAPTIANAFITSRSQLPAIADGGCSVVTVYFDVATQRLLPIRLEGVDADPATGVCNGYA
jgi:hypothetical protein